MPLLSKQHSIGWEDHLWWTQFFLEFCSSFIFFRPWEMFFAFWQKSIGRVVETVIHASCETYWGTLGFFEEHSYMVKSSIQNFSDVFRALSKKFPVLCPKSQGCQNRIPFVCRRFLGKAIVFESLLVVRYVR